MASLNDLSTRATAWWCDSGLRWTILDFKAGAPFGSTRRLLRDPRADTGICQVKRDTGVQFISASSCGSLIHA